MASEIIDEPTSIYFNEWHDAGLEVGEREGVRLTTTYLGKSALAMGDGSGCWTSNVIMPHSPFNQLVGSWQASTPGETSIETRVQVYSEGAWTKWFSLGQWTSGNYVDDDGVITTTRQSVEEEDTIALVDQDTFMLRGRRMADAYRMRVTLTGDRYSNATLTRLAAITSDRHERPPFATSPSILSAAVDLDVPQLSQYTHAGEYKQLDGGGRAWCSPTSVSMVMRYLGVGPHEDDISTLPADTIFDANGRADGDVAYAACHVFDGAYPDKNTGNWSFNMAYAGSYGLNATVRQYPSMQHLETLISQGIPSVITARWNNENGASPDLRLDGASIEKTAGHLLVVRGFTANGDVIVNDPASPAGSEYVRRIYAREQLERLWLSKGGVAYVMKPE